MNTTLIPVTPPRMGPNVPPRMASPFTPPRV